MKCSMTANGCLIEVAEWAANQSLFFFLNAACLAEKQQIQIL
jgi:hypothetical protein